MVSERKTSTSTRRLLKIATQNQIRAVGGLEAAASFTRVGKTELGYYQSMSHQDRFIPIDVAADLAIASQSCELVAELNSLVGCLCVPASPGQRTALCANFQRLGDTCSSIFRDFPTLLAGRRPRRRDVERLDRDLGQIIQAAVDARSALRAISEDTNVSSLPCCAAENTDDSSA